MKTLLKRSIIFTQSWQIDLFMKKILVDLQKVSILLISVFFISCENPTDIGFDFDGNADAVSVYTDTLGLEVSTILADSTVNGNSNFILSGVYNDPELGSVKASAYFQPSLVAYATSSGAAALDTFSVKANPVADSLRLRIVSSGQIFGDTATRSFFNIYRLKSSMNLTKNYNGDEKIEYEGESLARFGINSKSFKTDSNTAIAVFITLPKSIAQEILGVAPATGADKSKFNNAVKGFAIVPESTNKAVYSFATGPLGPNTSTLVANWHYEGDTTKYLYTFDLNGPRHTFYEFNRGATLLSSISRGKNELNSKLTNNHTYVQGGSGLSTKVNFDKVKNLGSNIRVSKAVLEFQLKPESLSSLQPKIFNFVLGEVGSNNQQTRNSSNLLSYLTPIGNDLSGAVYTLTDSTNTINIDVTNYLQKITNRTVTSKGLMIMPAVLTTSGNGLLANDNLRRVVFRKPKLKLYYTKY
jgi:hypothetical protein